MTCILSQRKHHEDRREHGCTSHAWQPKSRGRTGTWWTKCASRGKNSPLMVFSEGVCQCTCQRSKE
eukprot:6202981-Pleurochrysis_carterae.AAC.2